MKRIAIGLVLFLGLIVVPFIPLSVVWDSSDAPSLAKSADLAMEDALEIEIAARGGEFLSVVEIVAGYPFEPFAAVTLVESDDVPYAGSVEDESDAVIWYDVGHGLRDGQRVMVFVIKTDKGWKVASRTTYTE